MPGPRGLGSSAAAGSTGCSASLGPFGQAVQDQAGDLLDAHVRRGPALVKPRRTTQVLTATTNATGVCVRGERSWKRQARLVGPVELQPTTGGL